MTVPGVSKCFNLPLWNYLFDSLGCFYLLPTVPANRINVLKPQINLFEAFSFFFKLQIAPSRASTYIISEITSKYYNWHVHKNDQFFNILCRYFKISTFLAFLFHFFLITVSQVQFVIRFRTDCPLWQCDIRKQCFPPIILLFNLSIFTQIIQFYIHKCSFIMTLYTGDVYFYNMCSDNMWLLVFF